MPKNLELETGIPSVFTFGHNTFLLHPNFTGQGDKTIFCHVDGAVIWTKYSYKKIF